MGKKLDIIQNENNILFLTAPASRYPEGDNFLVLYEMLDPFGDNEELTDNIVGYEILNMETLDTNEIPGITEKYDVPEMGIKDAFIKDIVIAIKDEFDKLRYRRKTA